MREVLANPARKGGGWHNTPARKGGG